MSQIFPAGGPSPSSNELFTLITQLAHYLKILIRIALTGSIKLEREYNNQTAMTNCLARLNLLAMDSGDPNIKKRGDWPEANPQNGNEKQSQNGHGEGFDVEEEEGRLEGDEEQLKKSMDALTRRPTGYLSSTKDIAYGYRSLAVSFSVPLTLFNV